MIWIMRDVWNWVVKDVRCVIFFGSYSELICFTIKIWKKLTHTNYGVRINFRDFLSFWLTSMWLYLKMRFWMTSNFWLNVRSCGCSVSLWQLLRYFKSVDSRWLFNLSLWNRILVIDFDSFVLLKEFVQEKRHACCIFLLWDAIHFIIITSDLNYSK